MRHRAERICYTVVTMKEYAHLIAAAILCGFSISILIATQTLDTVKPLDIARLYTKKWVKPDISSALHEVRHDSTFLDNDARCIAMTNLSTDPVCLDDRQDKRDAILKYMQCTEYGSQLCSYLRLILQALAQTSTTERVGNASSAFKVFGANLKTTVTPAGETYRQMLYRAIEQAPLLFHGAYLAEESDNTIVLRSSLYTFVALAIFGNILVHVIDTVDKSMYVRSATRAVMFFLVIFPAFVFWALHTGSALIFWLIFGTGLVNLLYFEAFLDPTIVRPWIHPFTFGVVYMSVTALALVENGILEYNIFVVHMLLAAAGSQLFMSNAWYYTGFHEKRRLYTNNVELCQHLMPVYETKETSIGLVTALVLLLLLPLHLALSPYNFTYKSLFLALSPLIFAGLSLFSILVVENLKLDDEYGKDYLAKAAEMGWNQYFPFATVITGGKLYSSLMLLAFGAAITLIWLSEHIMTARAFMDTMPEASIQLDTALTRRFLIGQGLNLLSVH